VRITSGFGGGEFTKTLHKVYQLLAHGRWFSPGTPASSTTKSGRHDIAEILLKVALKHQIKKNNQNKLLFINRSLFRTTFSKQSTHNRENF
jgi:hypothetical protein